ncbi:MAG: hypothetical protein ACRC1M_00970 [Methanobacteriaceae archaeon]
MEKKKKIIIGIIVIVIAIGIIAVSLSTYHNYRAEQDSINLKDPVIVQAVDYAFENYDKNKDNHLDQEELIIMGKDKVFPEDWIESMFVIYDFDNDNKIDKHEYGVLIAGANNS